MYNTRRYRAGSHYYPTTILVPKSVQCPTTPSLTKVAFSQTEQILTEWHHIVSHAEVLLIPALRQYETQAPTPRMADVAN